MVNHTKNHITYHIKYNIDMPVTAPPKRKQEESIETQTNAKTEKEIKAVINRGGSPISSITEPVVPIVKIVNVSLTTPEIETIALLREQRPRNARSKRKTPISLHAWLVEAAQEKIEREKKKFGV